MIGNGPQDRVQRPNSERGMRAHGDTLMRRMFGLKNDMTTDLMNFGIAPIPAKTSDKFSPADVTKKLHGRTSISSRTKRRRTFRGAGLSK